MSTMPAWHDGRLVPRPFILRLLLARVGDGWRVMPGGFVRVADDSDARAVNLQQGGRTADAWVLSDKPVVRAHAAADAGPDRHQSADRRAAEPRRGQSVLARPLCRAHRGDAARWCGRCSTARPRATQAALDVNARICALLVAWDAVPDGHADALRRRWSRPRRCSSATLPVRCHISAARRSWRRR